MRLPVPSCFGFVASLSLVAALAGCSEAHFFGQSPRISGSPLQPTRHRDDRDLPAGGDSGRPESPDGGSDDGRLPGQTGPEEPVQTGPDQVRCLGKQSVLQGAAQDGAWHSQTDLDACLRGESPLLVVVLVDQSAAMGRHRTPDGRLDAGLDPWTGDGCRRRDAAQDLTRRILAATRESASVSVQIVPYAGRVIASRIVGPLPLDALMPKLTADLLCSYVVPDTALGVHPENPGGLDGARLGAPSVAGRADLDAARSFANQAATASDVDRLLVFVLGRESLAIQTVAP